MAASDASEAASLIDAINRTTLERAFANSAIVGGVQYLSTKTTQIPVISESQPGPPGKNAFEDALMMGGASLATDAIGIGVVQKLDISPQNAAILSDALLYTLGEYFFLGKKKVFRNLIVGAGSSYFGGMLGKSYTNAIIDNVIAPASSSGSSGSNPTTTAQQRSTVRSRQKTQLMAASPPTNDFSSTGF